MAVYTHITEAELKQLLSRYNVGELVSFTPIAEGVENSNYLLSTTQDRFILTLYEKRVNEQDLPFFLELMEHLAGGDIACPLPVHTREGELLQRLQGRPAALITFLQGKSPLRITGEYCLMVGRAMAQLHKAAKGFLLTRANGMALPDWKALFHQCGERADNVDTGLAEFMRKELDFLEYHWPTDLPEGVIHADLFPDNVFFKDGHLSGIIDFYFACNDWLTYDVAIGLNAWCFEASGEFNVTKARQFLQGYQSERVLTRDECMALPVLARGAAMRFLVTRLYDWLHHDPKALVKPKDPMEYVRKLRFHQHVNEPAAYGL